MKKIKFPLARPYITKGAERQVIKVLRSGWLTQGKYVEILEKGLKEYNNAKYAFLLNSATSGLILAVKALNLNKKDEVICPAFTFPATSNAVIAAGSRPVFCDIELDTFNISLEKIERAITKNAKAIMPVSEFGLPADMEGIIRIAKRHNLFVIEDAACALGAQIGQKKIGSFGILGVISFHPRKIITSGEGGCIFSDSSQLAEKIMALRNHGEFNSRFINYGYNFRMSDIQGAVLLEQFRKLELSIAKRIELASNYNKLLSPLEKVGILRLPVCPKDYRHTYQSYVILLSKDINRNKLKTILREHGIETQFGSYCVPLLDFYKNNFGIQRHSYKNARFAYRHTLSLPLYYALAFKEQIFISEVLKKTIKRLLRN